VEAPEGCQEGRRGGQGGAGGRAAAGAGAAAAAGGLCLAIWVTQLQRPCVLRPCALPPVRSPLLLLDPLLDPLLLLGWAKADDQGSPCGGRLPHSAGSQPGLLQPASRPAVPQRPPPAPPPPQEEQQAAARGRIAVIADEAHRAHGHSSSEQMHRLLGAAAGGSQPKHLTYFGFTATPSAKALSMFGVARPVVGEELLQPGGGWGSDDESGHQGEGQGLAAQQGQQGQQGQVPLQGPAAQQGQGEQGRQQGQEGQEGQGLHQVYSPFHSYPMSRAIEEGFVLDVLQSYCTVTSHVQIGSVQQQGQQQAQEQVRRSSRCSPLRCWVWRGGAIGGVPGCVTAGLCDLRLAAGGPRKQSVHTCFSDALPTAVLTTHAARPGTHAAQLTSSPACPWYPGHPGRGPAGGGGQQQQGGRGPQGHVHRCQAGATVGSCRGGRLQRRQVCVQACMVPLIAWLGFNVGWGC
jgi:hypothetical protein